MEIRNRNEQTIGLYENYGLRFIGKTAVYYSNLFNEEHDIITHIAIINTETNETIYKRALENNFIRMDCFNRSCDEILFYFSHNTLDSYSINKTIEEVLIRNNGSLFVHRMKQEIKKEEKHLDMIKQVEEHEKEYNQVATACNEKNYILHSIGSTFYVIAFTDIETKNVFNSLPNEHKESYIKNINEYSNNRAFIVVQQDTDMCMYNNRWYYVGINKLLDKIA